MHSDFGISQILVELSLHKLH